MIIDDLLVSIQLISTQVVTTDDCFRIYALISEAHIPTILLTIVYFFLVIYVK